MLPISCLLITLGVVSRVISDDLDGFVPGFKSEQVFIPADCTYRAREGDYMYQDYTGTLTDGTVFDSSYERGNTFNFHLGIGQVIKGIDMGMKGMCKGEKRKITIPPALGYGDREVGKIPAESTLIFDVVLSDLEPSAFKIDLIHMPENCTLKTAYGDLIREHYNGTFIDGKPFDSSYDRNQTYDFTIGEQQVIKGVDMGLMNMCQGERRRLTIPPILAYGSKGYGEIIPADTTLVFDVELVEIVSGKLKWYKIDGPDCSEREAVSWHDTAFITYNGFSETGYKFSGSESSEFSYTLGHDGSVLHGLQEGMIGMCVGERRRLRIPPELAVGDVEEAGVEQGVRLTLDVELIQLEKEDLFEILDKDKDESVTIKEVEEWIGDDFTASRMVADDESQFDKLVKFYFTDKDLDSDGRVTRAEFDRADSKAQHDEL